MSMSVMATRVSRMMSIGAMTMLTAGCARQAVPTVTMTNGERYDSWQENKVSAMRSRLQRTHVCVASAGALSEDIFEAVNMARDGAKSAGVDVSCGRVKDLDREECGLTTLTLEAPGKNGLMGEVHYVFSFFCNKKEEKKE
ncbi:MAG: hypothetical protein WC624_00190 [Candidatus Margulisiibacteriota bacterium]